MGKLQLRILSCSNN